MMASARFFVAGAIIYLVMKASGRFSATSRQWRDNIVIGAFMLLGGNGLVVWAEQEVPSGIATLVISVIPVFVVVAEGALALAFPRSAIGATPNALTILGLGLGFAGLALLVWPALSAEDTTRLDPLRIFALVMACVSWTIGTLASRHVRGPVEPFCGAAIQMLAGGVWLALVACLVGEPYRYSFSAISVQSWWAWVYLVIAGSLMGFTAFVWLTKHCAPASVATYAYINPIVAVFLGWWILNESVGPRIFGAAATIIAGVALITYSKQRRVPPATTRDDVLTPPERQCIGPDALPAHVILTAGNENHITGSNCDPTRASTDLPTSSSSGQPGDQPAPNSKCAINDS